VGSQPNERLADVMRDAGLSSKALARRVREISAQRGHPVSPDHTSVGRWVNGMQPRGRTPEFVAAALSAKLGRTVTIADIGMDTSSRLDPESGVHYASTPADAVDALTPISAQLVRGKVGLCGVRRSGVVLRAG
jgi:hypothetical protein